MSAPLDTHQDLPIVQTDGAPPLIGIDRDGELWWNSATGALYIFYDAGWRHVGRSPGLPAPPQPIVGGTTLISVGEPVIIDEYEGDLWYDPVADAFYVRRQGSWVNITMYN